MTDAIPAYAVAYLRDVAFGDEIIRHLRGIDGTLAPFGGESTSRPTTNASFLCG